MFIALARIMIFNENHIIIRLLSLSLPIIIHGTVPFIDNFNLTFLINHLTTGNRKPLIFLDKDKGLINLNNLISVINGE